MPGDLISFEGEDREPPAQLPPKDDKNPWFRVKDEMQVGEDGVARWRDKPFATPKGVCTVATLRNVPVH